VSLEQRRGGKRKRRSAQIGDRRANDGVIHGNPDHQARRGTGNSSAALTHSPSSRAEMRVDMQEGLRVRACSRNSILSICVTVRPRGHVRGGKDPPTANPRHRDRRGMGGRTAHYLAMISRLDPILSAHYSNEKGASALMRLTRRPQRNKLRVNGNVNIERYRR